MDSLLKGKTVAITGATTGIGRGIAIGLAKYGANIATVYLPSEKVNAMTLGEDITKIRIVNESDNNAYFTSIEGDVSDPKTSKRLVKLAVEQFGELNVMVANAGICKYHDFLDSPEDLYYSHIRVNLDGVYFAVKEAGKQMKAQGKGGSIIATGSIRSLLGGAKVVEYTASKGGVLSIVQAAAAALGPYGIRCNALLPGAIDTEMSRRELAADERAKITSRIPMGRFGEPQDLAGPVAFLASEMSAYMNGTEMLVDGGMYINLE